MNIDRSAGLPFAAAPLLGHGSLIIKISSIPHPLTQNMNRIIRPCVSIDRQRPSTSPCEEHVYINLNLVHDVSLLSKVCQIINVVLKPLIIGGSHVGKQ